MNASGFVLPTVQYMRPLNQEVLIVQILICLFLYLNFLMIFTFFKKEAFYTTTRYIFFAHTLVCDSANLAMTNILLLLSYSRIMVPGGLCVAMCVFVSTVTYATPLTLTAMSVERYVAICLPLRHSEFSTPVRAAQCLLVIQVLSLLNHVVLLFVLVAVVPLSFYTTPLVCSIEVILVVPWQENLHIALAQLYYLVMSVVLAFTYVKIAMAARAASYNQKASIAKGMRTVMLHGFQLWLLMIKFLCPIIEKEILKLDLNLYIQVRYVDYILFILAPRCLNPLIYGLRDHDFVVALKKNVLFGCHENVFGSMGKLLPRHRLKKHTIMAHS